MAKKVLIVDDSLTVRQQVKQALTQAGFEVLEAVDGLEGLERIQGTPALAAVICDVNMPRLNGLDLLERVRSGAPAASPPILMLTTEGHPTMMERARKAGAKGWIIKPFKADLLVAAVRKLAA